VNGFFFDSDAGESKEEDCGSSHSVELAADLLASERYLSGSERSFLETVVARQTLDHRRLREIAGNHGRYL
jgi:hypothetical protein